MDVASQFLREWDGVGVGNKIKRIVKMRKGELCKPGGEGETVSGCNVMEDMRMDHLKQWNVIYRPGLWASFNFIYSPRTYVDADPVPTHCKNLLIKYRMSCNHGIFIDITPSFAPVCT